MSKGMTSSPTSHQSGSLLMATHWDSRLAMCFSAMDALSFARGRFGRDGVLNGHVNPHLLRLHGLVHGQAPCHVKAPRIQIQLDGVQIHGLERKGTLRTLPAGGDAPAGKVAVQGLVCGQAQHLDGFLTCPIRLEDPIGMGGLQEAGLKSAG